MKTTTLLILGAIGYALYKNSQKPTINIRLQGMSGSKQEQAAMVQAAYNAGWRPGMPFPTDHAQKPGIVANWGLAPDRSQTNPALLRKKKRPTTDRFCMNNHNDPRCAAAFTPEW